MEHETKAIDVPIVKLVPTRERQVSAKSYAKLVANIKAVGLIEPLCVFKDGDQYHILDGHIRYRILVDLAVPMVPCLVIETRDLYTPNRQVNYLSSRQEMEMLRAAQKRIGEKPVSEAFGLSVSQQKTLTMLEKDLHEAVLSALKEGTLLRCTAEELLHVTPKRQVAILKMMKEAGDFSRAFARVQVLRTPAKERSKKLRKVNPWERGVQQRKTLARKLQEVEKHYDFYSTLYHQYVRDLLKLAIYVRQLLNRPKIRAYLEEKDPGTLKLFQAIVEESEGQAAAG